MTLSLVLVLLLPVCLIPAVLLPDHRLRMFLYGLIGPAVLYLVFAGILFYYPGIASKVGLAIPFYRGLLSAHPELTSFEEGELSYALFSFLLTLVLAALLTLLLSLRYIGKNPDIHKPTRTVFHVLRSLFFFAITYGILFHFFACVRYLLPVPEGFLSPLFQKILPLGA